MLPLVLLVIVIRNPSWREEVTTYSKGRVSAMNKDSQNHFKKSVIFILPLIFLLGRASPAVYGVSFPDYFPLDPAVHGVKTFQWTYGGTGTYSSYISGTLTVPYASGDIEGTGVVNFEEGKTLYATNNDAEVKLLSINNAYFSTDQFLTAHPAAYTFSTVTDDMLVDMGIYYDVSYDLTSWYLQDYLALLFDIQDVTIPLGQQNNAVIMWFLDEDYPFTSLSFYGKDVDLGITLPDDTQTGGRSVTDFMIFGNGIGMIAVGDIDAESGELVNLAELVEISSPLDIERIGIMTECEYVDGIPDGLYPWDFEIDVYVSEPGALDHINVTNPPGALVVSETIYQTGPGLWEFDPPKDASLDDLRDKYPEGIYAFEFYDGENSLLKTVYLDYSGLLAPADPVDFTYPSSNGETGVSTDPTFTWTIAADAGDVLAPGIDDEETGEQVYYGGLLPMTTLSWIPGPLEPDHDYHLDVTVSKIKDWAGPDNLPTVAVEDDEFIYYLTFDYINTISFTTGEMPSDLDIDMLGISATKQFRDGEPQGDLPWSLDITVWLADPDNLHHIDVTKPDDSVPFVTLYEEPGSPGLWGCSLDDDYATLTALHDVYKEGPYKFEFRTIDNLLVRSLDIDYTDLPGEPNEPVEFVHPSENGQTGISVNPTFEWSLGDDAGDALMMAIDDDETVYFEAPVPIGSTTWTPGPLSEEHEYELDVFVINVKDWAGGPGFPTMTDSTGDTFSYAHTIEYLNEIAFTTQSSAGPVEAIEEVLDLVDESVDAGTLTGDGPGKSADNRLNALINMLEEAQSLIEAGLYEEACDQLWAAYRKCDGDPRPPDFVTGGAADDVADMILLTMDELGCE
jgi:hypothetical protein